MQSELICEQILIKPTKKYSMDYNIFTQQSFSSVESQKSSGKYRKMTYDFFTIPERVPNPLEKDILFQKMNEQGIIWQIDLDQDF